jgi:hypothetical protein
MALSRIKTWAAEVLTYATLNAEFDNILTNGGGSLSSPRTADFDFNGYKAILDDAQTTWVQGSTQNVIDFYGASTLLFKMDMSVASPVNAMTFLASATGSDVKIVARGTDTNINIDIVPKGSGVLKVSGTTLTIPSADNDQFVLGPHIFG